MGLDTEAVGAGLGSRLRGVVAALDRYGRFAIAPGREGPAQPGLTAAGAGPVGLVEKLAAAAAAVAWP